MATYKVKSGGKEYEVTVTDNAVGGATVTVEGRSFEVEQAGGPAPAPRPASAAPAAAAPAAAAAPTPAAAPAGSGGPGEIVAPIPGAVTKVLVKVGDKVSAGQIVLRLEAMKMENDIAAPQAGTVKELAVSEGAQVADGQLLMVIG